MAQAVSFQTGHTAGNGCGFNTEDVSYTISTSVDTAIAEPIAMASGQAHAEIGVGGGGSHADGAARGAVTSNGSDVFPSLCATDGSKLVRMRAGKPGGGKGALVQEGVSGTLATGNDQTLFQPVDFRHVEIGEGADATQTLQAKSTGGYSLNYMPGVTNGYVVRRLTPEECERLQGMPTGHTRIPWKGKPAEECPDGPRYKAIGNSFAVPVVRWLGVRLEEVDRIMRAEGRET